MDDRSRIFVQSSIIFFVTLMFFAKCDSPCIYLQYGVYPSVLMNLKKDLMNSQKRTNGVDIFSKIAPNFD